jgi:hypothetical protein
MIRFEYAGTSEKRRLAAALHISGAEGNASNHRISTEPFEISKVMPRQDSGEQIRDSLGEDVLSPRTIYLSRLLGLYYLLITVGMVIRKEQMFERVTEIFRSPAASFTAGLIGVAIGLAIVLAHNVWRGGALAVVVTLLGWIALIKSLLFLYLTPQMEAEIFLKRMHYKQLFYFYMAISLAIGVYLTYGGFVSSRRS